MSSHDLPNAELTAKGVEAPCTAAQHKKIYYQQSAATWCHCCKAENSRSDSWSPIHVMSLAIHTTSKTAEAMTHPAQACWVNAKPVTKSLLQD